MIQKVVNFLICIFILGSGSVLHGLDPTRAIREYNLETYTTEDGLPQSSVLTIVQNKDGYIWMGTYEGLARFDGIRFRVFDTVNTPEMGSNRIKDGVGAKALIKIGAR